MHSFKTISFFCMQPSPFLFEFMSWPRKLKISSTYKHLHIWHASLRLIGLKINLFRQSIRHHSMTVFMTQNIMNHDACLNSGLSELPPPQILVDQLTLSQSGRRRLCPSQYYLSPQGFLDLPMALELQKKKINVCQAKKWVKEGWRFFLPFW